MTRSATLKAVNCTSCGAGLDILGGGRVTTHVCPYCGSVLNTNDDYHAVKAFGDLERPDSPFPIGVQGRLFGTDYTVIGTLGLEERWRGRVWQWVEHQIYSETHGYAWLCFENGHATFSRRIRDNVWLSSQGVEISEARPVVSYDGEQFAYYDTSDADITYAEGEFTWQPKKGNRTRTVTAKCDTRMLEFSESHGEREIYLTTYVPPEDIEKGFGIKLAPTKRSHELMPIKKWQHGDFLISAAGSFAILSIVLGMLLTMNQGQTLVKSSYQVPDDFPITVPFEITQPDKLTRIDIDSTVRNGWAYLNIELTDPEDSTRFELGRTSEYYSGRDSEGSWTEDSSSANISFRPMLAGDYNLSIDLEEVAHWQDNKQQLLSPQQYQLVMNRIDLKIVEGRGSGALPIALAFLFAAIAAIPLVRRTIIKRKRWYGSDWTHDD